MGVGWGYCNSLGPALHHHLPPWRLVKPSPLCSRLVEASHHRPPRLPRKLRPLHLVISRWGTFQRGIKMYGKCFSWGEYREILFFTPPTTKATPEITASTPGYFSTGIIQKGKCSPSVVYLEILFLTPPITASMEITAYTTGYF